MRPSPGLGPRIGSALVVPVALAVATNAQLCPLGVVSFPPDLVAVPVGLVAGPVVLAGLVAVLAGRVVVVVWTDAWVLTVAAILAGLVRLAGLVPVVLAPEALVLVPVARVRAADLVRAAQRVAAGPAVRGLRPAHPGAASLPRPRVPGSGRTCPAGPRSSSCWQRP